MPDLEAIGDAATGGVIARAVEQSAGEASGHTRESRCLNCGSNLAGPYCHACGQRAHVHRTLGAFWHDLAHGVLHLDGKIWRTLPLLAWRPGELTRRYVNGERAKFVSPMALFLFSVFLMFAVFTLIGGPVDGREISDKTPAEQRAEAERQFARERAETLGQLRKLESERARLVADQESTTEVDVDIANARSELELEQRLFRQAIDLVAKQEARGSSSDTLVKSDPSDGEAVLIAGADQLNAWFNRAFRRAKENPSLLIYKLQNNAYKFSWLLIPISIPFLWLLFLHRRRYRQHFNAYDHTVFVTYSIAFMSLAVIALSLLGLIGMPAPLIVLSALLVPPVHIYRQLKGAYGLSRWSALWRTGALLVMSAIALAFFAVLLLVLGVVG